MVGHPSLPSDIHTHKPESNIHDKVRESSEHGLFSSSPTLAFPPLSYGREEYPGRRMIGIVGGGMVEEKEDLDAPEGENVMRGG